MKANQATWPIATMARLLKVWTSGFYAWLKRHPCAHALRDADLLARIRTVHACSRGTYGMPRIYAEFVEQGIHTARKRVRRLMNTAGLRGVSRRAWASTTRREPHARPAPDLVRRHFSAKAPNQLWVADATYVPTVVGFLYLTVVLDVFSRRVVGWATGCRLRTGLMLQALNIALAQRHPHGVIHHSDQGCQGEFNRSSQHPEIKELQWQQQNMVAVDVAFVLR
jgi:transposase InsO family protein